MMWIIAIQSAIIIGLGWAVLVLFVELKKARFKLGERDHKQVRGGGKAGYF